MIEISLMQRHSVIYGHILIIISILGMLLVWELIIGAVRETTGLLLSIIHRILPFFTIELVGLPPTMFTLDQRRCLEDIIQNQQVPLSVASPNPPAPSPTMPTVVLAQWLIKQLAQDKQLNSQLMALLLLH